jgi:NADH-quinone oxidoreductase subunit N
MAGFDPAVFIENLAWMKPELLLAGFGLLLLLASTMVPGAIRQIGGWLTLVVLAVAAYLVTAQLSAGPGGGVAAIGAFPDIVGNPAFVVDGFSVVFKLIFLLGGAFTVLMSMQYPDTDGDDCAEFLALVVFSVFGMMFLASGTGLITIYIGLETMALAGYLLVGFRVKEKRANEGAVKYFIMGALASGILLYGISLVYGATGSINLYGIAAAATDGTGSSGFLGLGIVLMLVGIGFKVAAVPFHMWAPDAYEGATTPATSFLATAAKAGAFAMLLRIFITGFGDKGADWAPLMILLAAASMTVGNIAALRQENIKRMLAFSSVGHAGYVLMGLIAVGLAGGDAEIRARGLVSVALYLFVYTFATAGAFALVALLRKNGQPGEMLDDFNGLVKRHPLASFGMLLFLLSLAGIPCTAGFIGKWWLFGAAIRVDLTWLAVVAVLNSVVSLYYYARVMVAIFIRDGEGEAKVQVPLPLSAAIGVAGLFTLFIGVYPQPFIRLARFAVLMMGA